MHGFDATTVSDFFFEQEHHMLRAQVRRFVEEEIKPHGDAWKGSQIIPTQWIRQDRLICSAPYTRLMQLRKNGNRLIRKAALALTLLCGPVQAFAQERSVTEWKVERSQYVSGTLTSFSEGSNALVTSGLFLDGKIVELWGVQDIDYESATHMFARSRVSCRVLSERDPPTILGDCDLFPINDESIVWIASLRPSDWFPALNLPERRCARGVHWPDSLEMILHIRDYAYTCNDNIPVTLRPEQ